MLSAYWAGQFNTLEGQYPETTVEHYALFGLAHFTLNGFAYSVLFGLAGTALFGLARFVPVLYSFVESLSASHNPTVLNLNLNS